MAYQISDDCISCGACAAECPVSAISEGDGKFVIDADVCIECGACEATCPRKNIQIGQEVEELKEAAVSKTPVKREKSAAVSK